MELNHDLPDEVRRVITTGTYSEENLKCVDCGADDYEWCSLSFGVFVCLVCAGFHRSLGTHITTVRSMKLDSISSYQLDIIRHGGNHKFREYLRTCRYVSETTPIEEKYVTPEVLYYRYVSFSLQLRLIVSFILFPIEKSYLQKLKAECRYLAMTKFTMTYQKSIVAIER